MSYAKTLKGINDLDGINDINTHWGVEGYIVLIIDNWLWAGYVLTLDPTKPVSMTKMVSMTLMDIEVLKDILLTIDNWLWTGYLLTPKTLKRNRLPGWYQWHLYKLRGWRVYYWLLTFDFGQVMYWPPKPIPHNCHFLYANAISRPGKGTPKKCVNSRHCLTTKQRKTILWS